MTPKEREAAQMALDALEHGLPIIEDFGGKEQLQLQHKAIAVLYEALRAALAQPEQEPTRSQKMRDAGITRRPKGWDKEQELEGINEVILNSIRDSSEVVAPPQRDWQNAALRLGEELSTVGPDGYYNMSASEWLDWAMNHITPARIEQAPPCATGSQCVGGKCERCAVQPEQEPQETIAKWIKANTEHKQWYICPKCSHQTPRWKDEWVGLTDEERKEIIRRQKDFWGPVGWELECAKAIEAKLRRRMHDDSGMGRQDAGG